MYKLRNNMPKLSIILNVMFIRFVFLALFNFVFNLNKKPHTQTMCCASQDGQTESEIQFKNLTVVRECI